MTKTEELTAQGSGTGRSERVFNTSSGWKEFPPGGVIRGGANSHHFKTGEWRTYRPRHIEENCIHCLLCWIYCPDLAIVARDGKMLGFDYEHCKGCGICAEECPTKDKAIEMVAEPEEESGI